MNARGIAYNKTLFAEKGWAAPTSHEEFISLVKTICAETDMLPITLPGMYSGTYFTLMSELSHCDFLMTADGVTWAQDFSKGEASSREGFGAGHRADQGLGGRRGVRCRAGGNERSGHH